MQNIGKDSEGKVIKWVKITKKKEKEMLKTNVEARLK